MANSPVSEFSDKVFSEPTSPGVKLDALAHTTAVRQGTVILQEAAAGDLVGFSNADTVYIRLHVLGPRMPISIKDEGQRLRAAYDNDLISGYSSSLVFLTKYSGILVRLRPCDILSSKSGWHIGDDAQQCTA